MTAKGFRCTALGIVVLCPRKNEKPHGTTKNQKTSFAILVITLLIMKPQRNFRDGRYEEKRGIAQMQLCLRHSPPCAPVRDRYGEEKKC